MTEVEKKGIGKAKIGLTVGLIVCVVLVVLLAISSVWLYIRIDRLQNQMNTLETDKNNLQSQMSSLQTAYDDLNSTYIELRGAYDELMPFTYYTVDDRLNITNVSIEDWYVRGNITNVGDTPIGTCYVYVILRNSDGTLDFSPYDYEKLTSIYMGETVPFEIMAFPEEGQTVEILLIY